jgi:hypothetical protein
MLSSTIPSSLRISSASAPLQARRTFTICYSGTDCYLDHALVLRKPKEMQQYNQISGYIPSKIHRLVSELPSVSPIPLSTTLNGCGGPYNESREDLPIRIWSEIPVEVDESTSEWKWHCSKPPYFLGDTESGKSLELIAIAGIAKMLGITLHLVPLGRYSDLLDEWPSDTNDRMEYEQKDLQYPENDQRWNRCSQSEAGTYCLRWSTEDNNKIQRLIGNVIGTVALVGHSRGGVACLVAANYLAEWFPGLMIKIVALDPVPGSGNWCDNYSLIPAVGNLEYVGIYAIDETSAGFNAVVPRVKNNTDQIWNPLLPGSANSSEVWEPKTGYKLIYTRGRHATVPGSNSLSGGYNENDPDVSIESSGNLVYALTVGLLCKWGVPLAPIPADQVFKWIQTMNSASAQFAAMRNYNYGPMKATGLLNGLLFYKARGISSGAKDEERRSFLGNKFEYLEPYITSPQDTERALAERGLIEKGLREKEYPSRGGTKRVHPWYYLSDYLQSVIDLNISNKDGLD